MNFITPNVSRLGKTGFVRTVILFLFTLIFSSGVSQAQSLQLTGSPQWVNLGDLDVTGNQITVEALIYHQSGSNVVSKHTGPNNVNYLLRPATFELTTTTQFYLMVNPFTLQANTWYHIAGVYNGSFIRYYVNGCLVIEQAASGNLVTNNLNTAIGNISSSPFGEQFTGRIDEVRIWNTARTQAQIIANMNDLPNPTLEPNLRAYYKFTNNLLNSQGNATFNGTAVGAISYGPEPPIIASLSIVSVAPTHLTCFNAGNGSVTITASGGGVQYSLDGTNYVAGNTFSNLAAGNYTAYIRSPEGCVVTQPFTLTQPAQLISTTNATICSNQTYTFNGTQYNTAGIYNAVNPGSTGCDSTSVLNLTVISASGPPPPASQFNTGTNGAGGTLPGGTNDASWRVATNNINGPYTPAVVMNPVPGAYYSSPWPDCEWISHNAAGNHSGNVSYFYRVDFDLPCFNNCGQSYSDDGVFCLNLDFFADNSIQEIYVNGVAQSAQVPGVPSANPYGATGFTFGNMISASLCNDWQAGTNTLILEVRSGSPYAGFLAQTSINPPALSDTVHADICTGQSYAFGGNSYNTTGNYTVNFQTVAGCDSLVTLDLLVKPLPAQPTVNTNSPVCEGATIQLNTANVNQATYAWSGPNSWTATSQNATLANATATMAGTYSLTVTVNGCTSPAGTANVVVNPIPDTPMVNIAQPVCEGQSLIMNGFGGAGAQYHWSGPLTWTSTLQNPQINGVSSVQSGNYSLYVVVNGCTSATATRPVSINPKPTIQYNGGNSFCGTEATLTAIAAVAEPANINSYNWYVPGNPTPIGGGSTLYHDFTSVNPTAQQTVTVVTESSDGCRDTATATITLYAKPNTTFTWQDLCNGSNVQFNDDSNWDGNPSPGNAFTFDWNFGDAQTDSISDPNHAYNTPGDYTVTLITGSTESACTDTAVINITLHPVPAITLTAVPEECGQSVHLHAGVNPYSLASGVNWDLGDGGTSTDTTLIHTYQQAGTYNLVFTVSTAHNCTFTETGSVVVKPSPSINTVPIPNIITPDGDGLNESLVLDGLFDDCLEYEMKIMNRWGNLIYSQRKGQAPFEGKGMFGKLVTPGVYFYVIKSQTEEQSGTITVTY